MRKFVCTPLGALCALALFCQCTLRAPQAEAQTPPPLHATTAPPALADTLRQLLPTGTLHADVMKLIPTARMEQLGNKMQAGIRRHPQWFAEAIQKNPGRPVPYHPNLGLTRAEYREMMQLLPGGMQLKKVLDATLTVRQEGNRLLLEIEPVAPQWTGLEIDLDALTVKTPYGLMKQHASEDTRDDTRHNNRWVGTEWTLEQAPASVQSMLVQGGTILHFAVGKLTEPGKGHLLYEVKKYESGKAPINLQLILHYDLPAPSKP